MSKKMEAKAEQSALGFEVDDTVEPLQTRKVEVENVKSTVTENKRQESNEPIVNVLRNERVIVRHIPKQSGMVTDPKHVYSGGMAEGSFRIFVVPRLRSGAFVNVLTK